MSHLTLSSISDVSFEKIIFYLDQQSIYSLKRTSIFFFNKIYLYLKRILGNKKFIYFYNLFLNYAIISGDDKMVKMLIYVESDLVNLKNEHNKGNSALIEASIIGNKVISKMLIDAGANINIKNNYGVTPLMEAVEKGNKEIVKTLIENGADVNKKDNKGFTVLFYFLVANEINKEIFQILIAAGININIENNYGQTAFSYLFDINFANNETKKVLYNMLIDATSEVNK